LGKDRDSGADVGWVEVARHGDGTGRWFGEYQYPRVQWRLYGIGVRIERSVVSLTGLDSAARGEVRYG
jgi:hypothetical protein